MTDDERIDELESQLFTAQAQVQTIAEYTDGLEKKLESLSNLAKQTLLRSAEGRALWQQRAELVVTP